MLGNIRNSEHARTYSHAEFYPGPNLNMIIGPNGTGKSTMVAAIILGLGGNPKIVGRGTRVAEYVKHSCTEASIDIHLQDTEENKTIRITRQFDIQDRSVWFINGKKKTLKDVLDQIKPFRIQVDNLCQFLPQDRVQDFAKMNKQDLLRATQLAVCREDLIEKQNILIETKNRHAGLKKMIDQNEQKLSEAQETNARLESKVRSFNKKKDFLVNIQHIDRKSSWLQYEQLRFNLTEVKEDKTKATEVYERHKNSAKPMEHEISIAKKTVSQLQSSHSNVLRSVRETEKTLQEKQDRHDSFKQAIQRAKQEMNVKLDEFQGRDSEIDSTSRKIEELKEAQKKFLDRCGSDQQVLEKVKRITTEIEQMTRMQRKIEDEKDDLVSQKQNRQAELRMVENEMNRLENIRHQRLQKLQQIDKHAYQAVLWLRNNKHSFKGEVCEPMMLEINVLDSKNAIFLENVITRRDRLAFTCEKKEDMNLLIHSLRNQQQLSVNVLHSSKEIDMNRFQPSIPIEQLRQFGLHAYLHSLFTAPDLIMNYLFKTYGIHNIPVGNQKVNRCFEQIPNQVRLFFSDTCRYSVRFSKYTGAKSTRQNQISSNNTLSISLDVIMLANLRGQIQEKQSSFLCIDKDIKNYDLQLQQSRSRIQELQSELKVIRDLKQQIQTIGSRYAAMQKKIETLKLANSNRDSVKREADEKIKKIIMNMVSHQKEILNVFKTYNKLIVKSKLSTEKIELARKKAAYIENQFNETRRLYQEAEEILNQVKERYANALGQAKAALQKAKNLSKGFTPADEGFDEYREMYDRLSNDQKALQLEKDQLLSKIDCLRIADDGELEEYEKRLDSIEKLKEDVDRANNELNKLKAQMEKLEEEWLVPLSTLVTEINLRFSNAFMKMDCAGEVAIWTGDNSTDYSQYGLSIKVSYRNGEPLQELNSTIQSGGERAVATAAFMLSLQELTPAPFRCVDEINQGMDSNNERRIFNFLVDCTTQPNTSQYFLITPKLVPHLKYSSNMMIHIVHNGPFVTPDRKWYLSKLCNPQDVRMNI
ncbi:hypothetical protein HHI36_001064 [Cryptolaemus montrouzieri]|uniref:Structural maintenance of chromosomes protein 5 n=1 Tax=Cryptolaemus montrouzieri TaxID=559131 RepID=A0ABD2P6K7_9CUCU